MNDWSQIYLQHSTLQRRKRNVGALHRNYLKRNLGEKNRHCNPFEAKSSQQSPTGEGKEMRCLLTLSKYFTARLLFWINISRVLSSKDTILEHNATACFVTLCLNRVGTHSLAQDYFPYFSWCCFQLSHSLTDHVKNLDYMYNVHHITTEQYWRLVALETLW